MQFVNLTTKTVYTTYSGTLPPGKVSADGGPKRRKLEEVLNEIVKVCGNSLGIRLNAREAELLNKLMTLDEKGGNFDRNSLPSEVRNDPTGEKRAAAAVMAAQQSEMKERESNNAKSALEEAEINGETRHPTGPGRMAGEPVTGEKLKSGFEQIMEENARIAAGEGGEGGGEKKPDAKEILDPIGAHAKKDGEEAGDGADAGEDAGADAGEDADQALRAGQDAVQDAVQDAGQNVGQGSEERSPDVTPGATPAQVQEAKGRDDDGTRSADASIPGTEAPVKGNRMDEQAAKVAEGLGHVGPVKPNKNSRKKGQGK